MREGEVGFCAVLEDVLLYETYLGMELKLQVVNPSFFSEPSVDCSA